MKLRPSLSVRRLPAIALATAGLLSSVLWARAADGARDFVANKLAADYPALDALYKHLHTNPELSLMEEKTAARLAAELRSVGYAVTEKFGGTGIVGVLQNGPGPVLYIRTDLDGLPIAEETGLPYASKTRVTNLAGQEVPVMQGCGHDIHMTVFTGTARMLAAMKDRWAGTVLETLFGILPDEAARILAIWLRNGLLIETEYRHPDQRKPRLGLKVVDSKRPTTANPNPAGASQ